MTSETEIFGFSVKKHAESEYNNIFIFYPELSVIIAKNMFFHVFRHRNITVHTPPIHIGRCVTPKKFDQHEPKAIYFWFEKLFLLKNIIGTLPSQFCKFSSEIRILPDHAYFFFSWPCIFFFLPTIAQKSRKYEKHTKNMNSEKIK